MSGRACGMVSAMNILAGEHGLNATKISLVFRMALAGPIGASQKELGRLTQHALGIGIPGALAALKGLSESGLAVKEDGVWFLTPRAQLLVDQVLHELETSLRWGVDTLTLGAYLSGYPGRGVPAFLRGSDNEPARP